MAQFSSWCCSTLKPLQPRGVSSVQCPASTPLSNVQPPASSIQPPVQRKRPGRRKRAGNEEPGCKRSGLGGDDVPVLSCAIEVTCGSYIGDFVDRIQDAAGTRWTLNAVRWTVRLTLDRMPNQFIRPRDYLLVALASGQTGPGGRRIPKFTQEPFKCEKSFS